MGSHHIRTITRNSIPTVPQYHSSDSFYENAHPHITSSETTIAHNRHNDSSPLPPQSFVYSHKSIHSSQSQHSRSSSLLLPRSSHTIAIRFFQFNRNQSFLQSLHSPPLFHVVVPKTFHQTVVSPFPHHVSNQSPRSFHSCRLIPKQQKQENRFLLQLDRLTIVI